MLSHESILALLYAGGILLWFFLWNTADGFALMRTTSRLLWVPFLGCVGVLLANLLLWHQNAAAAPVELEESLFHFLDARSGNIITATGSVLVIATIIYGVRRTQMPKEFIRFQALAFICLLGFSAPIVWIPTNQPMLLMLLRHYQTIPFTYGIFLSVSGIIVLLHALGVDLPADEYEKQDTHMRR